MLLVVGFIEWIQRQEYGLADMLGLFAQQLGLGLVRARGRLARDAGVRAVRLSQGLYPVASLATVALAFGAADFLHGSGFLAAYVSGLALGSAAIPASARSRRSTRARVGRAAHDVPDARSPRVPRSSATSPRGDDPRARAALSRGRSPSRYTLGSGYSWPRRLLGWAGLRGAVPVVLATFPIIEGVPKASSSSTSRSSPC